MYYRCESVSRFLALTLDWEKTPQGTPGKQVIHHRFSIVRCTSLLNVYFAWKLRFFETMKEGVPKAQVRTVPTLSPANYRINV
jgi:hypothetical protein